MSIWYPWVNTHEDLGSTLRMWNTHGYRSKLLMNGIQMILTYCTGIMKYSIVQTDTNTEGIHYLMSCPADPHILWVLKYFKKFMAHSLTMLLRQNLLHKIALEYCRNIFQYKFVTVGKKIEYKSDVCFDLSLWCLIRILHSNKSK